MKIKINKPEQVETIEFSLDPIQHPIAYAAKLDELVVCGMTDQEAKDWLSNTYFELEVYYAPDQGLFMLESEFLDHNEPCNPYDGKKMERCDE
jgi:hypothetical protein